MSEQNTEEITKLMDSMFIELNDKRYSKIRGVLKIAYTELVNKKRPSKLIILRLTNSISMIAVADKLTFTKQFHHDYAALKHLTTINSSGQSMGGAMSYSGDYLAQ